MAFSPYLPPVDTPQAPEVRPGSTALNHASPVSAAAESGCGAASKSQARTPLRRPVPPASFRSCRPRTLRPSLTPTSPTVSRMRYASASALSAHPAPLRAPRTAPPAARSAAPLPEPALSPPRPNPPPPGSTTTGSAADYIRNTAVPTLQEHARRAEDFWLNTALPSLKEGLNWLSETGVPSLLRSCKEAHRFVEDTAVPATVSAAKATDEFIREKAVPAFKDGCALPTDRPLLFSSVAAHAPWRVEAPELPFASPLAPASSPPPQPPLRDGGGGAARPGGVRVRPGHGSPRGAGGGEAGEGDVRRGEAARGGGVPLCEGQL